MENRTIIERHLKHLEEMRRKCISLVQAFFEENDNGEAMDDSDLDIYYDNPSNNSS